MLSYIASNPMEDLIKGVCEELNITILSKIGEIDFLQYIKETNFAEVKNGEYEIDGRDVFVRINTYATEDKINKKPEAHNQYIDVQYLGAGEEIIYFTPRRAEHIVVEDHADESDLLFYEEIEEKDHVVLQTGDFAVFFPWELHRPGCSTKNGMQEVQKIVVKIKHKNQ